MNARWNIAASIVVIVAIISAGVGPVAAGKEQDSALRNFNMLLAQASSLDRGGSHSNAIALTFDGSWLCDATEPILATLSQKGVRATFFLTGEYIRRYPDLVRRIVALGNDVGNHTYSHPHLTNYNHNRSMGTRRRATREFVQDQLNRTHALYYSVTGRTLAPFWRAPYGEQNAKIRRWAAEMGYLHVGWTRGGGVKSLDTLDWVSNPHSRLYRSADSIARRVVEFDGGVPGGAGGAIILMHLGSGRSRDYPYQRLGWIIDTMQRKGYVFVTISGMLRYIS